MNLAEVFNESVSGPWITETSTDTQYRIDKNDKEITITFQGSVSRLDWLQNFSFWKKPYKRMSKIFFVHAGFLKKYKAVQEEIFPAVRKARAGNKHIKIRGYSQGAALALLCHEDTVYTVNYLPETKVFACPRVFSVFNGKLLTRRLLNVVRVQNGNDAVTKIPFLWMLYKHYGSIMNIGQKRTWFRFSFKDHVISAYRESL